MRVVDLNRACCGRKVQMAVNLEMPLHRSAAKPTRKIFLAEPSFPRRPRVRVGQRWPSARACRRSCPVTYRAEDHADSADCVMRHPSMGTSQSLYRAFQSARDRADEAECAKAEPCRCFARGRRPGTAARRNISSCRLRCRIWCSGISDLRILTFCAAARDSVNRTRIPVWPS